MTRVLADGCIGIIILTTNRVRAIDAAVQSRVNLAIQYHELTPEQRFNILKDRLNSIPDNEVDNRDALITALRSSSLARFNNKSNGRQIRNIVNGARALAKSEGTCLTVKHIERVEENTAKFTESMSESLQKQRHRREADRS